MQHRFAFFLIVCSRFVVRRHHSSQVLGSYLARQCCHLLNLSRTPHHLQRLMHLDSTHIQLISQLPQLSLMIFINQFQSLILLLKNFHEMMLLVVIRHLLTYSFYQHLLRRFIKSSHLILFFALWTWARSITVSTDFVYHLKYNNSQPMIVNLPTLLPLTSH